MDIKTKDPKLIALQFNECINNQDINGLANLMTDDHTFIDRDGQSHQPKEFMVNGWKEFFKMYPDYKNTFNRIESKDNLVTIIGFAYWSDKEPYDPVIWRAKVVDNLIQEWRVYVDTEINRRLLKLV